MARLVLGVTGSIAAIKAPLLIRQLKAQGHDVRVVVTEAALAFVTPTALAVLSEHPVWTPDTFYDGYTHHIEWAKQADMIVVAPATAHTLASASMGLANDPLGCLLLAARCPVIMAPAMHDSMWEHPATQANIKTLEQRGVWVVGPDTGALSSGDHGLGRMADPEHVAWVVSWRVTHYPLLTGMRIGVVMGGTQEPIDPVRYIGNRSTGQLGAVLAQGCLASGAAVTVISSIPVHYPGITCHHVRTAAEMKDAVLTSFPQWDALVMPAAVGDFRVAHPATKKQQKRDGIPTLTLVENDDILATVCQHKTHQQVIGFCVADGDIVEIAQKKQQVKGCDWIVANDTQQFGQPHRSFWMIGTQHATEYKGLSLMDTAKTILTPLASPPPPTCDPHPTKT